MKWKILVVEDEPGIGQFLLEGLSEEGFDVLLVADGIQASEQMFRFHPDLILLDWMLPQKSGIELLHEFRVVDQETPVILLTAKDTLDDTLTGFKEGANDYLKKPFHFEELLQRIAVQLRNKGPKAELSLGTIRVHLKRYQVLKEAEEIALTNKDHGNRNGGVVVTSKVIDYLENIVVYTRPRRSNDNRGVSSIGDD